MINVNELCNIIKNSYCYAGVPVVLNEETRNVSLVFTGEQGIYVFANDLEIGKQFIRALKSNWKYFFLFIHDEDESGESYDDKFSLYDPDTESLIELSLPYYCIETFYDNHCIPQADLPYFNFPDLKSYLYEQEPKEFKEEIEYTGDVNYIKPIVPRSEVVRIENRIKTMINAPYINKKIKVNQDGSTEVLKEVSKKIGFIDTMYSTGAKWYRCAERDSDDFFLKTFFMGLFGGHKFLDGKIMEGILYLLTCGMCGVMYVSDLITMIFGNYYVDKVVYTEDEKGQLHRQHEKVFNKPLERKGRAIILTVIAVILSIIIVRFMYYPALQFIGGFIAEILSTLFTETDAETLLNILS